MPKKINYKAGSLRKQFCFTSFKKTTPDNYVISWEKAWDVEIYSKGEDKWLYITTFALEENADKFINMVSLQYTDKNIYTPDIASLAFDMFKDS